MGRIEDGYKLGRIENGFKLGRVEDGYKLGRIEVGYMGRIEVGYKGRIYSRAHKLFGHSRVCILTIMIYVKRIIFSNDCISKRLKDRKLKLFS